MGLFAAKAKYLRQMPGRLCGETVDASGRRGFVLTLSTREQHIRRERRLRNICTNSGLASLAFTIHLTLLGDAGLRRLARINHANAVDLAERLAAVPGVEVLNETFFNEFTIQIPGEAAQVVERMARPACSAASRSRGFCRTRARRSHSRRLHGDNTEADRARLRGSLAEVPCMLNMQGRPIEAATAAGAGDLHRQSRPRNRGGAHLRNRAAGEYRRRSRRARAVRNRLGSLERKNRRPSGLSASPRRCVITCGCRAMNYAIDAGIYPLGSCTMKHNPRLNEKMARLPGFADIIRCSRSRPCKARLNSSQNSPAG